MKEKKPHRAAWDDVVQAVHFTDEESKVQNG